MKLNSRWLACALFALCLTRSVGAYAEDAAPAPGDRQVKVEERIRDLHATLHITAAQDAEWAAFAQVMLDNAQAMETSMRQYGGDHDKLAAPQIMENYAAISVQHAQNVARLSGALALLYADLSPEQKQKADEVFRARVARAAAKK